MHEYSIISALIDLCEQHARENNALSVARVKIAIGERSGVELELLKSAFEALKSQSPLLESASLITQKEALELYCKDCDIHFRPKMLNLSTCETCKGHNVAITKGRELHLLSLELDIKS